ncbi:hypothetical protein D3C80_2216340 [compost metagenome]
MSLADGVHASDVTLIELTRGDNVPVTLLPLLGTLKMVLIAKEGGGLGRAPNLLVEDVE